MEQDSVSQQLTNALRAHLSDKESYGLLIEHSADYSTPPPMPDEMITGVLRFGRKLVLAGTPDSGKTSMLLQLGLNVASGTPWLDMPTQKCHVLFVNLEIEKRAFINRVHQVAQSMGQSAQSPHFHYMTHRGGALEPERFTSELREQLIQSKLNGVDIKLVIIDPIYKLIGLGGGDEDSNHRVSSLISGLGNIAELGDIAFAISVDVLIHNPDYQVTHERQSGVGQLARDADCLLLLWPLTGHDFGYRLKGQLREFEAFKPKSLEFDFPVFRINHDLERVPVFGTVMTTNAVTGESSHEGGDLAPSGTDLWKVWDSLKTTEAVSLDVLAEKLNASSFEVRQLIMQAGPHPKNPLLKLRLAMGSKVKAEED